MVMIVAAGARGIIVVADAAQKVCMVTRMPLQVREELLQLRAKRRTVFIHHPFIKPPSPRGPRLSECSLAMFTANSREKGCTV